MFHQSGAVTKTDFIVKRIFGDEFRVVKVDKTKIDFYIKLSAFYRQFSGIAVNYNQVTKRINAQFDEKTARQMLHKLVEYTREIAPLMNSVVELTNKFEAE